MSSIWHQNWVPYEGGQKALEDCFGDELYGDPMAMTELLNLKQTGPRENVSAKSLHHSFTLANLYKEFHQNSKKLLLPNHLLLEFLSQEEQRTK